MYREHAGPPPPDPLDAVRQTVKNCGYLQIGVGVTNVVTMLIVFLRVGFTKIPGGLGVSSSDVAEWRLIAIIAAVTYCLVFLGWGGLNAWGLGRRSKVARWSSIAFAIASITTCCSWMFGAVLLMFLFKSDVKAYFR